MNDSAGDRGARSGESGDNRSPISTGFAVIDKEAGWTSHDVVAKARGILRTRKIGHSGTLDPDATGVLLLGVGRATRILRFLDVLPKGYTTEIVFGVETSTLDAAGEVTVEHDMGPIDVNRAREVAAGLTGAIMQTPPMVSAVKVDGKRLHELARQGVEVERAARPVTVHEFTLEPTEDPMVLRAHVECSTGTYVRVLAADLGRLMGGGAHLRELRRVSIGSFTVDEAHPIDEIEVLPAATAFRDFDKIVVDDDVAASVAHGRVLGLEELGGEGEGPYPVFDRHGELLAVYERHRDTLAKPAVVVTSPPSPTRDQ